LISFPLSSQPENVRRSTFGVRRSAFGGHRSEFAAHTEHGKVNAKRAGFGHRAEAEEEEIDQIFDRVHRRGRTDVRNDPLSNPSEWQRKPRTAPPNGER
jgi:hypothetical protein